MEEKKTKRKEFVIAILLVLILIIAGAYAWLTLTVDGTNTTTIKAGYLDLVLDDASSNGILLQNAIPMSYNQGIQTTEYNFTVRNNGTMTVNYTLSLEDFYEAADASKGKIADSKIRYILVKDNAEKSAANSKLLSTGRNIYTGSLAGGSSANFTLQIWIDSRAGNEIMEQIFSAKIKVDADQQQETTAAQTISEVSTLVSDNTEDNVLRYTGADVNNYVTFNDESWRIIGVYGDNLKLIRATSIGTQEYNPSVYLGHVWSGSSLQTYLNGTYYDSLTEDAKDKIEESGTWYVGEAAYDATASQAETSARATTWSGKVGLMASYEYLYAAESSCWTTAGDSYSSSCAAKDWLKLGSNEWTLSPRYGSSTALLVDSTGNVNYYEVTNIFGVRPAVYLKSNVTITGGNGTTSNPYTLG